MKIADPLQEIDGALSGAEMQTSARTGGVPWGLPLDRIETNRPACPWWLWWNILSLDAPAVAVAWAALLARGTGTRLPAGEAVALLLSVWVIYTCDRLLDGWTTANQAVLQVRHLFCQRHRFVLTSFVLVASALVLWLMADASLASRIVAGVKLVAILILYMAGIHAGRGRFGWLPPKEMCVGFLFAMGVTLPFWSRSVRFSWQEFFPWMLFGLLCSLNCLSIEFWENHREPGGWKQPPHPLVRWAAPRIDALASALAVAALTACLLRKASVPSQSALLAMCAAALLLLILNRARAKFSSEGLRVLADTALLIPALVALLIRG